VSQFTRDDVGVTFIGPNELRDSEATQSAGRRPVGVQRIAINADVFDVVWASRSKARFLRDPRANIGISAAIPVARKASEGWWRKQSSANLPPQISCKTGNLQGIFSILAESGVSQGEIGQGYKGVTGQFPAKRNREILNRNRELNARNRELL
jgi:hypothetical protein